MKRVTIKDLAKYANVSPATVSLVLNNKPNRISKEKKEEILFLAEKYNYTPNMIAKGLVTNKTNIIGLIIPDIENPFFATLAKVVEKELNKLGYLLILINTDDKFENDLKAINVLKGRSVDGFLIAIANESYKYEQKIIEKITKTNKPFVLVDRLLKGLNENSVSFDDLHGGYIATEHLIETNHKKIGYIGSPNTSYNGEKRKEGYLKALKDNNILKNEKIILEGDYKFDSGYQNAKTLIKENVDAIFAANDVMAYGALKAINESNLNVPSDISLIGYDDLFFSDMNIVSLTTVKQDQKQLGAMAVNILMRNIENKKIDKHNLLKPELIIRDTVREN